MKRHWTEQNYTDFLAGFATATGHSHSEAEEQWAGFSRQLTDAARRRIEASGYAAGGEEGRSFNKLYPLEEEAQP